MKTLAAVITEPFVAGLQEIELKEPGADDVVVHTMYSFFSIGTERHIHTGEFPDHPVPFPKLTGYQCTGQIESIGANVRGLKVGQSVFACRNKPATAISNPLGGLHAQTIVSGASDIYALPEGVDPIEASALVIAQVGFNSAARLQDRPKRRVIVLGDGLIGQFSAQAALARGFEVLLAGRHDSRLKLAKAAAPTLQTINIAGGGKDEEMRAFLKGEPGAVIDTVGSKDATTQCINLLNHYGELVINGYWKHPQLLDVHHAFSRELAVYCPGGWTHQRLLDTLELMRLGKMRVAPTITQRFKAKYFSKATALMKTNSSDYLGVLIEWE